MRAIDLVDNLKAVLVNRTTEVMFDAQTPLPTLLAGGGADRLRRDGVAARPDHRGRRPELRPLPPEQRGGRPPRPPRAHRPPRPFSAQITIGDLESTLLPLPPTTYSVDTDADLVPGFGAVQPVEAAPGLTYSAVARVPLNPTGPKRPRRHRHDSTSRAPPTVAPSKLAPYLKLPAEPAAVVALAHQIVAGAKGPAAEAAALARWFDSGRFRYTLSPPAAVGPDALESFLFTTRAGFCQQFAAAYGVLARIDGLPTRVAVGFTTGERPGPPALPGHRGRRPCLARGLSRPVHGLDLLRAHARLVGRGHRGGRELGLEVERRRTRGAIHRHHRLHRGHHPPPLRVPT